MPTLRTLALRTLAIVVTGVLAGLPVTAAQACDNDRYPCPVVSQTQETADSAVRPRKKANRAARQEEKARAKIERQAAPARTKAATPVGQEQAVNSGSRKAAEPSPTSALNDEVDRNESPVAAAAAAWLVRPDSGGAGAQAAASDAIPAAPANEVQVVDPNEVNELDLAAAPAGPAESSWLKYLLATLGAALAAASTLRFFV